MLEEFFFDGVAVEPGDGAQPPGDGRPGAAPGFQVAGEALDVCAADGEQVQGARAAPAGELAQVESVCLSCQPAVPGREPGERETFGIAECWLGGTRAVVVAVIGGTSRSGLRPVRLGESASATISSPPSSALSVTCCHGLRSAESCAAPGNAPKSPITYEEWPRKAVALKRADRPISFGSASGIDQRIMSPVRRRLPIPARLAKTWREPSLANAV